jgi:hypothetical protein
MAKNSSKRCILRIYKPKARKTNAALTVPAVPVLRSFHLPRIIIAQVEGSETVPMFTVIVSSSEL